MSVGANKRGGGCSKISQNVWSTALRQSQTYKPQRDSRPGMSHYCFATLDWSSQFCKAVVRTRYNIRVFIVSTTKYICINTKGRLIFYHFSQRRQPYHSDCELHSQGVLNEEEDSYKHLSRLVKDKIWRLRLLPTLSSVAAEFVAGTCIVCLSHVPAHALRMRICRTVLAQSPFAVIKSKINSRSPVAWLVITIGWSRNFRNSAHIY